MMSSIRIYLNYTLFILGIRDVLSRDIINKVIPIENHEPPVILSGDTIFTNKEVRVRASVAEKLNAVAKNLQLSGYGLFVYEGYRSNETQRVQWSNAVEKMKRGNPVMSDNQIEMIVQKQIARPDGVGGGHQTGGAVDLTLSSLECEPLDMGTEYVEFNEFTKTNAHIVSQEVHDRRKVLLSAMRKAGFVNYPNEWWHYSYGDRMWAAYLKKKVCPYDVL